MNNLQMPINPIQTSLTSFAERLIACRDVSEKGAAVKGAVKAAKDFESVLIHKIMEQMQRTIPESGLLDNGITKQVQGIFWFHLAQEVADNGGMGLWRDIHRNVFGPAGAETAAQAVEPNK